MSFESGSLSLRLYALPETMPTDFVERFAAMAAPPQNLMGSEAVTGWVTGRHLLDRNINEDSAMVAGYLRLTLMKAERIIPPALLKAECMIEQLALMQARDLQFLKRTEKAEIKKEVIRRLLPEMPLTLTGIEMAAIPDARYLYTTATTDKQSDAFVLHFRQATGISPVPLTAETLAAAEIHQDIRDIQPTSFSPEQPDEQAEPRIGRDFLTWLWFFSEACGGIANLEGGQVGVLIEGPLAFAYEGAGAHDTVLRKGNPTVSAEAKTALISGKKLRAAKVSFTMDEAVWKFTFDADNFIIRSVSLPKSEAVDVTGRFQDRMIALETLRTIITGLYLRFLEERLNNAEWEALRETIHKWVANRHAKA